MGRGVWRSLNYGILILVLALALLGVVNLYSATTASGGSFPFWQRQLLWVAVGLFLGLLAFSIDYRYYEVFAYPIYGTFFLALLFVLLKGTFGGGAKRWISLGYFHFQPSEVMKLALIFVIARYFQRRAHNGGYRIREILYPLLLTLLPAALLVKQPDLGTAFLMFLIFLSMVMFAGIKKRSLLILFLSFLMAFPGIWVGLKDYQRKRILAFLDPYHDPLGSGYHLIQSKIAVGSGELWGKGFLKGTQCKLQFLPQRHTDFAFAVVGEEWGFVGCTLILALYLILILWGLHTATKAKDRFGSFTALGITAMIFWHVVINVGMVLGMLPVVGLPLSFFSYGGSSIITHFIGIGILLNIRARRYLFTP